MTAIDWIGVKCTKLDITEHLMINLYILEDSICNLDRQVSDDEKLDSMKKSAYE